MHMVLLMHHWYNKVKEIMLKTDGRASHVDPAVFHWMDEQCEVTGILACHVDDFFFLWTDSQYSATKAVPQLKCTFLVSREEREKFCYVGIDFVSVHA